MTEYITSSHNIRIVKSTSAPHTHTHTHTPVYNTYTASLQIYNNV